MKTCFLFWLITALSAFGVETVAWRIPLELVVDGGVDHPAVSRLDGAPGESGFLEPGDELWDLSRVAKGQTIANPEAILAAKPAENEDPFAWTRGVETRFEIEEVDFAGDFVIWNARSQMIVARGSLAQLHFLEDFVDLQSHPYGISTTFTLRSGGAEKSLTIHSRSGEIASAKNQDFKVEIAPIAYPLNPFGELTFDTEIADVGVSTTTFLGRDTETRVARWLIGDAEHALFTQYRLITSWEIGIDEIQFVEEDGRILPQPDADALKLDGRVLPNGLRARVIGYRPTQLASFWPEDTAIRRLTLPERLEPWIPGGLLDLNPFVKAFGVTFEHPDAMVGYDALEDRVVAVNTPENLDIVEQIFTGLGPNEIELLELEFRWPNGLASIVVPSGQKASLSHLTDDGKQTFLEVASNFTRSFDSIDSHYHLSPPDGSFTLKSSSSIKVGKTRPIASFDGPVTLTARILPLPRAD